MAMDKNLTLKWTLNTPSPYVFRLSELNCHFGANCSHIRVVCFVENDVVQHTWNTSRPFIIWILNLKMHEI